MHADHLDLDRPDYEKLLDRAIRLIMDEHSYSRNQVLEWLSDEDYGWDFDETNRSN